MIKTELDQPKRPGRPRKEALAVEKEPKTKARMGRPPQYDWQEPVKNQGIDAPPWFFEAWKRPEVREKVHKFILDLIAVK